MSELQNKIDSLEALILSQHKKYRKNLKTAWIIYVILIVFVIVYTTVLYSLVYSIATPVAVADLVTEKVQKQLPELNTYLKENSNKNAVILADQTVKIIKIMIPKIGIMAQEKIEGVINNAATEISDEFIPGLFGYLKENKPELLASYSSLTDHNTDAEIVNILVENINAQMNTIMNKQFYDKLNVIQNQITEIEMLPESKLTKKQLAEKRFLGYWSYLSNYASENPSAPIQ